MLFVAGPNAFQNIIFQPESLNPDTFNITYLGEPLRYIVNNIQINVYQGNTVINLIDYFPLIKQGYNYKDELSYLLNAYILFKHRNPSDINILNEAFGGQIPVEFYNNHPGWIFESIPIKENQDYLQGKITPIFSQIPIDQAVESGIINNNINTYQYVQMLHNNFDPANYQISDLDYLIFDNQYSKYHMPELNEYLKDNVDQLTAEKTLATDIYSIAEAEPEFTENISLIDIINVALNKGLDHLLDTLSQDDRIKLYFAIIREDTDAVIKYLQELDPRYDNNEAYNLAKEIGNQEIIDSIYNNIIERNWYEKQVLTLGIESVIERASDIPTNLQRYIRK